MSNREIYRFLLKESRCSRQKRFCSNDCDRCPLFTDERTSSRYYDEMIEKLKSRDPELYFVTELEELQQIIQGGLTREAKV